MMDVDENVFVHLPSMLTKCMIYHCRVYTDPTNASDFILTGGRDPVLYEIQGKQILSSFHLKNSIFKGGSFISQCREFFSVEMQFNFLLPPIDMILSDSISANDESMISVNTYFSYKKKTREQFLFLQIGDCLAILGRLDKQLTVKMTTL